MPLEVKCVFQGGGAKLVTLLAAAEVLEEYELSGKIVVTEVAGTSAGSIAAYAFAHNKPTELLRSRMKAAAKDVIEHFSARPSFTKILWKIYRGQPIFDEDKLFSLLRATFAPADTDRPKISDARIPLHIRVSDIRNGRPHTYRPSDEIGIEGALIDSCAIPLALRTHLSKSAYADGGITSNLVDHRIFNDPTGNIIAFSFQRSAPYQFHDMPSCLISLASTSIDASVDEARSKIEASGGYVCELPNEYGTFDFRKALESGLADGHFAATKGVIREQLNSALKYFGRTDRRLNLETDLARVQKFTVGLLDHVFREYPYSMSLCSIICIANGLDGSLVSDEPKPDQQVKELFITAKADFLFAFHVGIGRREAYELGKDIRWEILDKTGRRLNATHEVIEASQNGSRAWQSCFVLDEPLAANQTPIKVRLVTSHIGMMKELLHGGSEWMRTVCCQDDDVQTQDFVLAYPKRGKTYVMTDLLDSYHRATAPPDNFEAMKKAWCGGRKMSESELERYANELLSLGDYAYIGWRCDEIKHGFYGGALIERAS